MISCGNGRMVLIESPEIPDAFLNFVNNSDDPALPEALRALREEVQKEPASSEPVDEDPFTLAYNLGSFRVTKAGRFRTGELVNYTLPHDKYEEEQLEERKAKAIRFEEYELEICTNCRRTREQIRQTSAHDTMNVDDEDECRCKFRYVRNREYDEAAKAECEKKGEEVPPWVLERLAQDPPEFKKVKFTRVFEPHVSEQGTWLREKLSTKVTF
jgi:hypothetical protein